MDNELSAVERQQGQRLQTKSQTCTCTFNYNDQQKIMYDYPNTKKMQIVALKSCYHGNNGSVVVNKSLKIWGFVFLTPIYHVFSLLILSNNNLKL